MARQPRLYLPGAAQHLIQRGNNRCACFKTNANYLKYISTLEDAALEHEVAVHAYVLMTNHVHLLVTPRHECGVSGMMQALGRAYVRYFNFTFERTGTLWEGRYKSTLVDSERYLLAVYRYIELNPVRAGMVEHALEYPWSSYGCNALGQPSTLLTRHAAFLALGDSDVQRQEAYRGLVAEGLS